MTNLYPHESWYCTSPGTRYLTLPSFPETRYIFPSHAIRQHTSRWDNLSSSSFSTVPCPAPMGRALPVTQVIAQCSPGLWLLPAAVPIALGRSLQCWDLLGPHGLCWESRWVPQLVSAPSPNASPGTGLINYVVA